MADRRRGFVFEFLCFPVRELDNWRAGRVPCVLHQRAPAQEDVTMVKLRSKEFWWDLWETLVICMQGEGEGLGK